MHIKRYGFQFFFFLSLSSEISIIDAGRMASPLHLNLISSNLLRGRFHLIAVSAYRLLSNSHYSTNFSKMSLFHDVASSRPKVDSRFNRFDIQSYTTRVPDFKTCILANKLQVAGLQTSKLVDLQTSKQCVWARRSSPKLPLLQTAVFDESRPMSLEPIGSPLSPSTVKSGYFIFSARRLGQMESDEALYVFLYMPEVKKEDVKVYVEHIRNTTMLVIEGDAHEVTYFKRMDFPKNVDINSSDIKGEMKDGMFKLTLPKLKDKQLIKKTNIFAKGIAKLRFKLHLRVHATLASVKMMFARTHIMKKLSPKPFNSFSMYKEVTAERLYICGMFGLEKTEFNRASVCVSLNMPELKIEDVKSYFKHDALFIEGKTKTKTKKKVHYITGIRLPESILKNRNMIKTEMKDGIYKASLPYRTFEINTN
ncbi:hypothetical protein L1987_00330 [Smallanthus sonchifolius]|uniref:Uncharacterized protein n=1 Tax=Smallanthus sonchifolius TaxID=185202 RepID=A0ACB9K1Z4_9ASTR|nr:hypothetical protein L1987_00330 [Smallanthus sonchifolius]